MSLLIRQLGNGFLGLIFKLHLKQTQNAVLLGVKVANKRAHEHPRVTYNHTPRNVRYIICIYLPYKYQ